jgi:hypothetical protein
VNAEQRARGAANLVPPIVLMVEGWADEDNFAKLGGFKHEVQL